MAILESITQTNMTALPPGIGLVTEQSASQIVLTFAGPTEYRATFTGAFEFGPDPDDRVPDDFDPTDFDPSILGPGFDPGDLLPDEIDDLLDEFGDLLPDADSFVDVRGTLSGLELTIDGATAWTLSDLNVPLGDGDNEGTIYNFLSIFELGLAGSDILNGTAAEDFLQGWAGNDTINGGLGEDFLIGMEGDDLIITGSHGDVVNGNEGFDTVIVPGSVDEFRLTYAGEIYTLDNKATGEPQTTLNTIERIIFDDGDGNPDNDVSIDVNIFDGIYNVAVEEVTNLVEMYVAYFNRAPDAPGLFYWGDRLSDGMTFGEIAASFFEQPETVARYPDPDDVERLVDEVYQNVLERAADLEGREYWIGELQNGLVARGEFILAIINGAKNFNPEGATDAQIAQAAIDARVLADKADIGTYFAIFQGLSDTDDASAAMEAYIPEAAEESLRAARDLIDEFASVADSLEGGTSLTTPAAIPFLSDPFLAL